MKLDTYIDVNLINTFPDMRRTFPDGRGLFQHDLLSCLSFYKVKKIFRKQKWNMLDWPGVSTNLNPLRTCDQ